MKQQIKNVLQNNWKTITLIIVIVFLVLTSIIPHVIRFGFNFFRTEHSDWDAFGGYLSGTVGVLFSAVSVLLLIYQWIKSSNDKVIDESQNRIERIISEHLQVLNNIKFYDNEGDKPMLRQGVEAFYGLYKSFYCAEIHSETIKCLIDNFPKLYPIINKAEVWGVVQENEQRVEAKLMHMQERGNRFNIILWRDGYQTLIDLVTSSNENDAMAILKAKYKVFFSKYGYLFGHYHAHLYFVLKTIDEANMPAAEKETLMQIFRSNISGAEQMFIYLNIESGYSKSSDGVDRYFDYVKKYRILKDLDLHQFVYQSLFIKNLKKYGINA